MSLVRPISVSVLLAMSLSGLAGCSGSTPPTEERVASLGAVVNLTGGGSAAVGMTNDTTVSIEWRDARSDNWTAPNEIQKIREDWRINLHVAAAGNTVVVTPDYWTRGLTADNAEPDRTGLIVCQPTRCEDPEISRRASGALISGDGTFVAFPIHKDNAWTLWTPEDGITHRKAHGLSADSVVRILPNGTLVAIEGRSADQACTHDLLIADQKLTFTSVATGPAIPAIADAEGRFTDVGCLPTYVEVTGDNSIQVGTEQDQDHTLVFTRKDGKWSGRLKDD